MLMTIARTPFLSTFVIDNHDVTATGGAYAMASHAAFYGAQHLKRIAQP